MDWTRGYSCRWRAFEVDPATWADAAELGGVASASVERAQWGQSGTLAIDSSPGTGWPERYVRLSAYVTQAGSTERVDVATLLCSSAGGEAAGALDALDVTGRSVLAPAESERMPRGSFVPAGTDGALWCADELAARLAAPVSVDGGGFTLDDAVVFDLGATVMDAVRLVLEAGGWCLRIDGSGRVAVCGRPSEPALLLDPAGARVIVPGVSHSLDWSGVPNRYTAVFGTHACSAVNDDAASPVSTVARGYTVDAECDTGPVRVGGESQEAYCARRLAEESTLREHREWTREWCPGVMPWSVVRGAVPSAGIEGDFTVERQSIECGAAGIVVAESAYREVALWEQG